MMENGPQLAIPHTQCLVHDIVTQKEINLSLDLIGSDPQLSVHMNKQESSFAQVFPGKLVACPEMPIEPEPVPHMKCSAGGI